ncbi:MAG: hypothetical protein ACI9W2_000419 [Gammaproteobacteria bacterium]|jgi:hypothetical protein
MQQARAMITALTQEGRFGLLVMRPPPIDARNGRRLGLPRLRYHLLAQQVDVEFNLRARTNICLLC